jgi:hypothetical protein
MILLPLVSAKSRVGEVRTEAVNKKDVLFGKKEPRNFCFTWSVCNMGAKARSNQSFLLLFCSQRRSFYFALVQAENISNLMNLVCGYRKLALR